MAPFLTRPAYTAFGGGQAGVTVNMFELAKTIRETLEPPLHVGYASGVGLLQVGRLGIAPAL